MNPRVLISLCLIVFASACTQPETPPAPEPHPGTAAMVERLARLNISEEAAASDRPVRNPFILYGPEHVEGLRAQLAATDDGMQQLQLRYQIAEQELLAGNTEKALEQLEVLEAFVDSLPAEVPDELRAKLTANLQKIVGVAGLRLAEQDNCVEHHTSDSCIFPISAKGVHRNPRGARRAFEAFSRQIEANPRSLDAVWLLNLAAMVLGEHPQSVPANMRLPRALFESEHEIPRFVDRARDVGLDTIGLAGGAITEDLDGDGFIDVVATSWGLRDQTRFFFGTSGGRFEDRTASSGVVGLTGGLNANHADYDNDGDADVLILRGGWLSESGKHPNSLLRNNGDGTFDDVTEEAGLLSFHPSQTAAWADFDNDGWLDLFVGNEQWYPESPHPSQLYRNNGDGTFSECAQVFGLAALGAVKGVAWGDVDNDRFADLYVSRFGQANQLFVSRAADAPVTCGGAQVNRRFEDVAGEAGVAAPAFSFPVWFWDYDNDGWQDLFVGAYDGVPIEMVAGVYLGMDTPAERPRLYRNRGDGRFEDVSAESGINRVLLAMGANYGDIDGDGYLDAYIGTGAPDLATLMPNRMFRNDSGRRFQDVTTSGGFGHLQKGHGIAFADIDNDGDEDVFAVMGGWFTADVYQNVLFENPGHDNEWIVLRLVGVASNKSGVGARIRVTLERGDEAQSIHRTVSTGGSFGSSTLQQEIGLGPGPLEIAEIEIRWPSGEVQIMAGVPARQTIEITEGQAGYRTVDRPQMKLEGGAT